MVLVKKKFFSETVINFFSLRCNSYSNFKELCTSFLKI